MSGPDRIIVHRHGESGPPVIVVHGGPGGAGEATPLAQGLAAWFRVTEPWQRASGFEPLTVARHVADLREIVLGETNGERPAIVGHSWGAMLALAFAAAHPVEAGPIVLIGCGTYDARARARLEETVETRMLEAPRESIERAATPQADDPVEQMRARHELSTELYSYAIDPSFVQPEIHLDPIGHRETWDDEMRLQAAHAHPDGFAAITSPVLMIHGDFDPHPGRMIYAGLAPYLRQIQYRELECCGHTPWIEKYARHEFFEIMREWLAGQFSRKV